MSFRGIRRWLKKVRFFALNLALRILAMLGYSNAETANNGSLALMSFQLKRFGLSIDDFGTEKTSVTRLVNVPFTEMKIDKVFVNGVSQNASALAILKPSIDIAKKLNMEIIAEGVEMKEDWGLVEELRETSLIFLCTY
jgi:EAL domain-containing protein (putative c-di-GMP-specific phosphodiesterase class I)